VMGLLPDNVDDKDVIVDSSRIPDTVHLQIWTSHLKM